MDKEFRDGCCLLRDAQTFSGTLMKYISVKVDILATQKTFTCIVNINQKF